MFTTLWNFLTASSGQIAFLAGVVSLIVGGMWKLLQNRQQIRDKRFSAYHVLIKELVNADDRKLYLDQQIAVVYELRNFPNYFPVSIRILEGLRSNVFWKKHERMQSEIDLTLVFIKSSFPKRFFWRCFGST